MIFPGTNPTSSDGSWNGSVQAKPRASTKAGRAFMDACMRSCCICAIEWGNCSRGVHPERSETRTFVPMEPHSFQDAFSSKKPSHPSR